VSLAPGIAGAEDALVEQLRKMQTASEIASVASVAETRAAAREAGAEELLFELARAWLRAKRRDESLVVLGRLARGFPDWASIAHLCMAEIHLDRNEEDAALAALEKATQAKPQETQRNLMDASNTVNEAYWRLGALLERRGEWKRAIGCYEAWKPRSWCGNCAASIHDDRMIAIARCRFHAGEVNEALASLEKLATVESRLNGWNPEAVSIYLEIAARSGRLKEAGDRIERIARRLAADEVAMRTRLLVSLALARAFEKKSPEDVLISVHELDPADTQVYSDGSGHVECEWRAAGRFLGELRAVPFLAEKIRAGDEHAIVVAGLSGLDGLIPFLAKQRARESGKTRKRIEEALDRLKRK